MHENTLSYQVSVVIPSYNYGKYIGQAIDSVLGQSGVSVDVVVVDDGSTDNTLDVLRAYVGRIRVFQQKNSGVSKARNLGIEKAKYALITFLDADDWMVDNSLYNRCYFLETHPECDWVYSLWQIANGDGDIIGTSLEYFPHPEGILEGDVFPALFRSYGGMHIMSSVFRLADVRATGGFQVDYKSIEDYDFFLKVSRGKKIGFCPDVFSGVQRIHNSHLTSNPKLRFVAEIDMLENYTSDKQAMRCLGQSLSARIANLYNYLVCVYSEEKKLKLCLNSCIQSILHKPIQRFAYRALYYILTGRLEKAGKHLKNDMMKMYMRIKDGDGTGSVNEK